MPLIRAELGSPRLTTCPICRSGQALAQPVLVITDQGVRTEP